MFKQISGFALGPIISALIGLIAVPILTRLIMPEVYAQVSLAQITIQLLSITVLLGLDQGYVREFYDVECKQKLLFCTLGLNVIAAFFIVLLILYFYQSISIFLFSTLDYYSVVIIAITLVQLLFLRYVALYLRMEGKSFSYSMMLIIQSAMNLLAVLLLLHYDIFSQLHAVLMANVLAISLALLAGCFRLNIQWLFKPQKKLDAQLLKQLLQFSAPLMISTMFMWILYSADQYMLRILSDFKQLGLYAVSYKLCAALMLFQVIISTVWVPICLRWVKEGRGIGSFERVGLMVSVALMVVFLLLLALKDYIILLLGSEYREALAIFPYLLMFPIYYTLAEVASVGIMISKQTKILMPITFACAAFNIGLNYYFIPLWGAKGAAIATAITFLLYFHLRLYYANIFWKRMQSKAYYYLSIVCFIVLLFSEKYDITYVCYVLLLVLIVSFLMKERLFIKGLYANNTRGLK